MNSGARHTEALGLRRPGGAALITRSKTVDAWRREQRTGSSGYRYHDYDRLARAGAQECIRGVAIAGPEQARERKESCRARPPTLGCGRLRQCPSLLDRRFLASTITSRVGIGTYYRDGRRALGYRAIAWRRSGHLVAAGTRAAPTRPQEKGCAARSMLLLSLRTRASRRGERRRARVRSKSVASRCSGEPSRS
jgi:hypothetical protein